MRAAPWLVIGLFVGLAISGCTSDNGKPDTVPTTDLPTNVLPPLPVYNYGTNVSDILNDPKFPRTVEIIIPGARGAEPNIGVTSAGNIFITAFDQTYRSSDKGNTWSVVYNFCPAAPNDPACLPGQDPFSTADPMLWVDPETDRIFTNHMFPVLTCSSNIISDDEGETWLHVPMSCGLPVVDHQKIMTANPHAPVPMGTPVYENVVYYCYNKLIATDCAVSWDGGIHYQYDMQIADSSECGGINGHPAAAPDGTVYVPLGLNCGQHRVAYTTDNGLTWTVSAGFGGTGGGFGENEIDPEMTVTPDGTAYYYSRNRNDGNGSLWRSRDNFATVDGPFQVNPPDVKGVIHAAMASGADGNLAIAYLGNRETGGSPSEADENTTWHLFVAYTYNADEDVPIFQTHQVSTPEDPVQKGCIWLQGGGGGPRSCRNLLDFIDGVVDSEGRFYATITDGCTVASTCSDNPAASEADSRARAVALAIQDHGPSLWDENTLLTPIGYQKQVIDAGI